MRIEKLDSDVFFQELRKMEYARLDDNGHTYFDYTAGNIHPQCLLDTHYRFLNNSIYGNPHSVNSASLLSEKFILQARQKVLEFFNAPDYCCVFTQNASGALQIVGECYPFSMDSHLLLTSDNHNSVNGIREYCQRKGGKYSYSLINENNLLIDEDALQDQLKSIHNPTKLFAFPAQSNASGVKHSLDWINKAHEHGWDVLLDAAAFVPTSKLDLSSIGPDFVSLSFYKMFGYPTGLGCLLIKKSKFSTLTKPWFAGGTVSLASVNCRKHLLVGTYARFENGTVNYLDIPAITWGLDFLKRIGMEKISCRMTELAGLLIKSLAELKHPNGSPLIKIYGPPNMESRGGNILLNFFDVNGEQYPFRFIERCANEQLISFRTGCFCNPGMDEANSKISASTLNGYFESRPEAEYEDMIGYLGKLRGGIRVSVGIPTITADLEKFVRFAEGFVGKLIPCS